MRPGRRPRKSSAFLIDVGWGRVFSIHFRRVNGTRGCKLESRGRDKEGNILGLVAHASRDKEIGISVPGGEKGPSFLKVLLVCSARIMQGGSYLIKWSLHERRDNSDRVAVAR